MIDCCCKGHSPYENVAREICFVTRCTVCYVNWVISLRHFRIWIDISICKVSIFMRKLPPSICDWLFLFFFFTCVFQFPQVDTKHSTLSRMTFTFLHVNSTCSHFFNMVRLSSRVHEEFNMWKWNSHMWTGHFYLNIVGSCKVWWDYLQWIIDSFKGCAWGY